MIVFEKFLFFVFKRDQISLKLILRFNDKFA